MVIDNYYVIWEIAYLAQSAFHGILHRPYPVEYRYNDRSRHLEIRPREVIYIRFPEFRFQPGSDTLQMSRADLLHLDLDITVLRIDIVKELLPDLRLSVSISV